jgi:predicted transcriptional regulator
LDWKKYGYVVSSHYRKKVVISLLAGPKTPKQIAVEVDIYLSHVSKTLNELSSLDIVGCLTPDLRRGRVYELKKDGIEIAKYLEK